MNETLSLSGGLWPDEVDDVEKQIFGYPAGKRRMKVGLVRMIPAHKTYVEPFAGSAAVFFGKQKSEREVIADIHPEVIDTFKAIQGMSNREVAQLRKMEWAGSGASFKKLFKSTPTRKMEKLYRFLYLAAHSYGSNRMSVHPRSMTGHVTGIAERAIKARERLQGVTIRLSDYDEIVKEFDGPDTVFFFDPPHGGHNNRGNGGQRLDEAKFVDMLKSLKGKFVLTYGEKGKADFSTFSKQRVSQFRSISMSRGVGRERMLSTLVVTNFAAPAYKAFEELEVETPGLIVDVVKMADGVEVPVDGEKRIATLKGRTHESEGLFAVDLWIDCGNHSVGWELGIRDGTGQTMKAFSVDGSRGFHALTQGVEAYPLGTIDHGVHKLDGEIEGGSVEHVDACFVEHGLHTETEREFFLSKGRELVGVLRFTKDEAGRWSTRLSKSELTPRVLQRDAVLDGMMPPNGVSALPASLSSQVPEGLRYWLTKGEDWTKDSALEMRDMLVASRFADKHNLAIVDGEIRKVERSLSLYEVTEPEELAPDWHLRKLDEHHSGNVEEQFDASQKPTGVNVAFYDLTTTPADEVAAHLSTFESDSGEFAISCVDTPQARVALAKHGRPFRFVPEHPAHAFEVCKRVFVTSFPLTRVDDVEWLDVNDGANRNHDVSEVLKKRLAQEISFLSKKEDERLVTGIVLEPETVDSQKDIYSADEVKQAALAFMEEFQNMGLMHKKLMNDKIKLVESFIAREDFVEGGQPVSKGTWLITVKILDEALWQKVKGGKLTGFSIGGSAVRTPEV